MKYLITGASGFIGSHLVDLLIEEGVSSENIRLLLEPGCSVDNLPDGKFDIVIGDIRNKEIVKKAVKDVDIIYHLAAMTVRSDRTYKDYKTVNVDGTRNLLDTVNYKKLKKFVFFSSIAVFGLPAYVGEIINWNEERPKKYAEDYGKSKFEAERLVLKARKRKGLKYAIVRPTSVYGPRDHQNILDLYKAIKHNLFFFIGDGKNLVDYVYVKDLVKGARQTELSKINDGDYILGGKQKTELKKVVQEVANSIDKNVLNIHIPVLLGFYLSILVERVSKFLHIKPLLFPLRVKVLTTSCYFDISKAKKEIGYNPSTTFKKGTELTAKWIAKKSV